MPWSQPGKAQSKLFLILYRTYKNSSVMVIVIIFEIFPPHFIRDSSLLFLNYVAEILTSGVDIERKPILLT